MEFIKTDRQVRSTRGHLTIGIDARAASHPQAGGFKTYVKNLLWALSRVDSDNRYRLYVDRPYAMMDPEIASRFQSQVIATRLPVLAPVWREQVLLPVWSLTHPVDIDHFPTGTAPLWHPRPTVVTIHDAIEHMPGQVTGALASVGGTNRQLRRYYNRFCQIVAARGAAAILTVSECSRRDIVRYLGIAEERIRVILEAPGPEFRQIDNSVARRNTAVETDSSFILAIGSADTRKNLAVLLRAYAALPTPLIARHRLVFVWTHRRLQGNLLDLARSLGIAERISSVSAPTDADLCALYNSATAFVFPSLYEGFGLPPLEAMACGTPVISSNASSLPEILGDAAILIDPRSVGELSQSLVGLLTTAGLRRELAERGIVHANRFSWERAAIQTCRVYDDVVDQKLRIASHEVGWKARKGGSPS